MHTQTQILATYVAYIKTLNNFPYSSPVQIHAKRFA